MYIQCHNRFSPTIDIKRGTDSRTFLDDTFLCNYEIKKEIKYVRNVQAKYGGWGSRSAISQE